MFKTFLRKTKKFTTVGNRTGWSIFIYEDVKDDDSDSDSDDDNMMIVMMMTMIYHFSLKFPIVDQGDQ